MVCGKSIACDTNRGKSFVRKIREFSECAQSGGHEHLFDDSRRSWYCFEIIINENTAFAKANTTHKHNMARWNVCAIVAGRPCLRRNRAGRVFRNFHTCVWKFEFLSTAYLGFRFGPKRESGWSVHSRSELKVYYRG